MRMKRGDLEPALVIDCTNTDGVTGVTTPANLTTATAVRVVAKRGTTVAFVDAAPTRDNANGRVTHIWQTAETAATGRILAEVEVMWPGSRPQTFPANGYVAVDVVDDLG